MREFGISSPVFLFLLSASACQLSQPLPDGAVPGQIGPGLEKIATFHIDGSGKPGEHVFTNQQDYEGYFGGRQWWLPEVDFERHMVVVVSIGAGPSAGGASVRVVEANQRGDTVGIRVEQHLPGEGCPATADMRVKSSVALFCRGGSNFNFITSTITAPPCIDLDGAERSDAANDAQPAQP